MAEVQDVSVYFVSEVQDISVSLIEAAPVPDVGEIVHGGVGVGGWEWPVIYDYLATGGLEYVKNVVAKAEFLPNLKAEKLRLQKLQEDEIFLMFLMDI